MIVMTPEATEANIAAVRARLETVGVHVLVLPGELTTAIGAIGDPQGVAELGLEGLPGVDRVVPISRPYKLASGVYTYTDNLSGVDQLVYCLEGNVSAETYATTWSSLWRWWAGAVRGRRR